MIVVIVVAFFLFECSAKRNAQTCQISSSAIFALIIFVFNDLTPVKRGCCLALNMWPFKGDVAVGFLAMKCCPILACILQLYKSSGDSTTNSF